MMSATSSTVPESPPSFVLGASVREMFLMALGSLVLLIVEVLMSTPWILFGRYLWIDELWTKLIASEPSVWQSLVALKHSGDPTPPVYHLLARASWGLVGGSGETAFRTLAFVSMWVALVLIYALLRRTFAVLPALVAVLAFWSSPPIIEYAFFARPYAPLLAAIAGFCLIYGADKKGPAATALTAAAGPIAVAACWPFVHAWNTGQTVFSYLPPQSLGSAVRDVFLSWGGALEATVILAFAWSISSLARLTIHLLGYSGEARTPNIGPLQ